MCLVRLFILSCELDCFLGHHTTLAKPKKKCSSYKHSVYIFIGLRVVAVRKISTLPFQIFPLIGFFKLLLSESWWDFAKSDSDPTDYDKIPWSFIVAMLCVLLKKKKSHPWFLSGGVSFCSHPFKCPLPLLPLFFSSFFSNPLLDFFSFSSFFYIPF